MKRSSLSSAVSKINRQGILLVFPVNNKKEPKSLWAELHPRTPMVWEWDDSADSKVADLWHLRRRLSESRQVVYTKWFRGRATVMSFDLFRALLCLLNQGAPRIDRLSFQANEILDILNEDSPLSTKQLKAASGLQGREFEKAYEAALKELWKRLLIVGFGEVDEGAFPSLAIGATQMIFEDLWQEARGLSEAEARKIVDQAMPQGSAFRRYYEQVCRE